MADLIGRSPSRTVKFELRNVDWNCQIPIEAIYEQLRPYGIIRDIITKEPVKDVPRFCKVHSLF